MTNKEWLKIILVVGLSAAGYFYSTLSNEAWIWMWFASLPLCLYALESSFIKTFVVGFIAYFLGGAVSLVIYYHTPIPQFMSFIGNLLDAFSYTLILLIFRFMALRFKHWLGSFVFASGFVAYDFLSSMYFGGITYSNIAYTQLLNLPILQLASLTGIWGITFLLTLIPASFALAWHYRHDVKLAASTLVLPILLFISAGLFGMYQLNLPNNNAGVKVGLAALHITGEDRAILNSPVSKFSLKRANNIIQRYVTSIEELAKLGAEVILLPEEVLSITEKDDYKVLPAFTEVAIKNKITLIAGLGTSLDKKNYNSAYIFSPAEKLDLRYDKWHLVPVLESRFTPGNKLITMQVENKGLWGIAICRDMDYQKPALAYSKLGVNILFVPAWDFHVDDWIHARYALMRGVEGNFAMARTAQNGILTLTDSNGRIVALKNVDKTSGDQALLFGTLKLGSGHSIYSEYGDWFALLCMAGFLGLLIILPFLTRKDK